MIGRRRHRQSVATAPPIQIISQTVIAFEIQSALQNY